MHLLLTKALGPFGIQDREHQREQRERQLLDAGSLGSELFPSYVSCAGALGNPGCISLT